MSTNHTGNTQPAIDQEEHTHINGIGGKKVYNIDTDGNVLNFRSIALANASLTTIAQVGPREQTPTGPALQVQIGPGDIISNLPVVLQYDHHQVHEGEAHHYNSLPTTINTDTHKYAINVPVYNPTIQAPHMLIGADVYNGSVRVDVYESATFSGGATVTPFNRNRNDATLPGAWILSGVTSTNGTRIAGAYSGAGTRSAGSNRALFEYILKSDSIYRVDITGLTAGTVYMIDFDWYEDLGV